MRKFEGIIFALVLVAACFFTCMFTMNWLLCKSFERFDNAETKMVAPFTCSASFNGGEFEKIVW